MSGSFDFCAHTHNNGGRKRLSIAKGLFGYFKYALWSTSFIQSRTKCIYIERDREADRGYHSLITTAVSDLKARKRSGSGTHFSIAIRAAWAGTCSSRSMSCFASTLSSGYSHNRAYVRASGCELCLEMASNCCRRLFINSLKRDSPAGSATTSFASVFQWREGYPTFPPPHQKQNWLIIHGNLGEGKVMPYIPAFPLLILLSKHSDTPDFTKDLSVTVFSTYCSSPTRSLKGMTSYVGSWRTRRILAILESTSTSSSPLTTNLGVPIEKERQSMYKRIEGKWSR